MPLSKRIKNTIKKIVFKIKYKTINTATNDIQEYIKKYLIN